MGMISTIIEELSNFESSLGSPLLKTKILASRIKHEQLLNWVTNELRGYQKSEDIPDYRKTFGTVEADGIIVEPMRSHEFKNLQIPVDVVDDELKLLIEEHVFYESIVTLEITIEPSDMIAVLDPFATDVAAYVANAWQEQSGYQIGILSMRRKVSKNAILQIISNVRNELLDFMLKLEDEFGEVTDINDLKNKNQQITVIMQQTVNTTGDGNVVNTGNNVEISAKITIKKGSSDDLMTYLKSNGINESDAEEIVSILDIDNPNHETQTFGQKAGEWIGKMVTKAATGVWKVGTDVATSVLTTALKTYYGWN